MRILIGEESRSGGTKFWSAFFGVALWALPASACPYCDSATGQQVRAGIFNGGFGYNLLLTLAPFPVLVGIVAVIYFGLPSWASGGFRQRSDQGETQMPNANDGDR